ncbi:hypothetical protein GCM10010199_63400 [Dactylosporangium roseum]
MRYRVVCATKGPESTMRSCGASRRRRYRPTVNPGTIQITFRKYTTTAATPTCWATGVAWSRPESTVRPARDAAQPDIVPA